jgi:MoxR-like ATPase
MKQHPAASPSLDAAADSSVLPAATQPALLDRLGVIGLEAIEPVVLGAVLSGEPVLLIGPHGTGKSFLLNRLCAALGLDCWRHYNASLLNFDDLVGYPLPNGRGGLDYVQTPASIWDAQAVFIDEISRCRPDLQNKLFPIIHERRVQGLELPRLVYRWSAMNPPRPDDDEGEENGYRGSEPLDLALADRFAFVVEVPGWAQFSAGQQERIILAADSPVDPEAARRLRADAAHGRALLPAVRQDLGPRLATYVRLVLALLARAQLPQSPRRAAILLRNIVAVHAARLLTADAPDLGGSAFLAVQHGLPQRATGVGVAPLKVLAAHREAWQAAGLDEGDPRRFLLLEADPFRRVLRAARLAALSEADFSGLVADALASLPPGGRHALAAALFESGAAGRLVAAVAEQCAGLYAVAATPHAIKETVDGNSARHRVWQRVVAALARLDPDRPEGVLTANLLAGLFARNQLGTEADVERALAAWQEGRRRAREAA